MILVTNVSHCLEQLKLAKITTVAPLHRIIGHKSHALFRKHQPQVLRSSVFVLDQWVDGAVQLLERGQCIVYLGVNYLEKSHFICLFSYFSQYWNSIEILKGTISLLNN